MDPSVSAGRPGGRRRRSSAAGSTPIGHEAAGLQRVAVVPNGYRLVDEPLGKVAVGSPPTILFQGTLRYPPNADAARYLIEDIRPAIAGLVPDAVVRLVGVATPAIAALGDRPGVTVVGQVPDIDTELARADLVLVPIRFGSGTRLKILEAFAHRIPVVSTGLGAEGLDAVDEHHLLIADTPDAIAIACARLLEDEESACPSDRQRPPSLRRAIPDRPGARRSEADRRHDGVAVVRRLAVPRGDRPSTHDGDGSR